MGTTTSPARLECDIVDRAMSALTGARMQPATYVRQLDTDTDTDNAGDTLSAVLARPVVHRSAFRDRSSEHYFVDVESGSGEATASAVRMTTDHSTQPPTAQMASVGDPVFFDSLIVAALDSAR